MVTHSLAPCVLQEATKIVGMLGLDCYDKE